MKKFGKILTVLLIFIFVFSFVACGSDSAVAIPDTDPPVVDETPSSSTQDGESDNPKPTTPQLSEKEKLIVNGITQLVMSDKFKITGTIESEEDKNSTDVFETQKNDAVTLEATLVKEKRNAGVKAVGNITKADSAYNIYFPNDDNTFYFNTSLLGIELPIAFDITMPEAVIGHVDSPEAVAILASLINTNKFATMITEQQILEAILPFAKTFVSSCELTTTSTGKILTYNATVESISALVGFDLSSMLEISGAATIDIVFNSENNISGIKISATSTENVLGVISNSETETELPSAISTKSVSIALNVEASSSVEFVAPENFEKNDYVFLSTNIVRAETYNLITSFVKTLSQPNYNVKMNLNVNNLWATGEEGLLDIGIQMDSTFFGESSYKKMSIILPDALGMFAGGAIQRTETYLDGKGMKYVNKSAMNGSDIVSQSNVKSSASVIEAANPMADMLPLVSALFPVIFGGNLELKGGACINDCISVDVVNVNGIWKTYEVRINMEGLINIFDANYPEIELPNVLDDIVATVETKDGFLTKINIENFVWNRYDTTVENGILASQTPQIDPLKLSMSAVFSAVDDLEAPDFTQESIMLTSDVAVKEVLVSGQKATWNEETQKYEITVDSDLISTKDIKFSPRDKNAFIPSTGLLSSATYCNADGYIVLTSTLNLKAGITEKTLEFVASDGVTPGKITLSITREANNEASLDSIKIDRVAIEIDENKTATLTYNKALSNDRLLFTVTPKLNSKYAVVLTYPDKTTSTTTGYYTLGVGENTFRVTVTAEDGIASETYTVIVNYVPVYSSIKINNKEVSFTNYEATLNISSDSSKLPFAVTAVEGFTAELKKSGSADTIDLSAVILEEGDNVFTLTFSDNNSTTVSYTITVNYTVPTA